MNEPRDHHYLPIFYLNQWRNPERKVVRYYRPHVEVVAAPIAPRNTGYEPYLYSLTGYALEHQQKIEKEFMARIDTLGAEAFQVLLTQGAQALNDEMRNAWTVFLTTMRLRNPEMIAQIVRHSRANFEIALLRDLHEWNNIKSSHDPATPLAWMEKYAAPMLENFGKFVFPQLAVNEKLGNAIIHMDWAVLNVTSSPIELLTSDRPYIQTRGLDDPKSMIAFPLSPTRAFMGVNDRQVGNAIVSHGPVKFTKAMNGSVVQQAHRHVYGRTSSHLRFVENRLRRRREAEQDPSPDLASYPPQVVPDVAVEPATQPGVNR